MKKKEKKKTFSIKRNRKKEESDPDKNAPDFERKSFDCGCKAHFVQDRIKGRFIMVQSFLLLLAFGDSEQSWIAITGTRSEANHPLMRALALNYRKQVVQWRTKNQNDKKRKKSK